MFTPIDSFDDVVARYESTVPMQGGAAGKDIRPLGSRTRMYERIVKIDEDTYALTDGNYLWGLSGSLDMLELSAPILWKRKTDGVFISIRGCERGSQHPSRWAFISWYLPTAMRFVSCQLKPYQQQVYTGGKAYGLVPISFVRDKGVIVGTDKDMSLVFKALPDGTFERVGQLEVTTNKVDVVRKKAMKPELDAFYEYMLTMAPFVAADTQSSVYKSVEHLRDAGFVQAHYSYVLFQDNIGGKIRHLLTAPDECENKLHLMIVISDGLHYNAVKDKKTLAQFKQRYNNWCTKVFNLYKKDYV
jgi:hypothetical protein